MSTTQTTPEVTWAQRSSTEIPEKNIIYLTIYAPDVSPADLKVDLTPTSVTLTGPSSIKKTTYHVALDLFAEIDPAECKTVHTAPHVAFVLRKKEAKEEFWPRLTKEKAKLHFLKTDFDKWVDEDEQDGVPDEDPAGGMGGAGGMPGMEGMGGMGGMGGGDGGFGGIDFSKLGAGGMPDMSALAGMGGMGGMGGGEGEDDDGDDDEDDDEMPDLAAETKGDGEVASKPKIEEIKD